jgi:hypothetical protein
VQCEEETLISFDFDDPKINYIDKLVGIKQFASTSQYVNYDLDNFVTDVSSTSKK